MIQIIKKFKSVFVILGIVGTIFLPKVSYAYPVFAQNAYQNPREATGRIVCANCHLAQKTTEIEVPQAVLPDTVFEAVVSYLTILQKNRLLVMVKGVILT
jgi:apocytochrome f